LAFGFSARHKNAATSRSKSQAGYASCLIKPDYDRTRIKAEEDWRTIPNARVLKYQMHTWACGGTVEK